MNDKITEFVEAMFSGLPKTQIVVETKLGIIENMQEKYEGLLSEGKNDNEAFGTVVAQFGTMDELKKELGVGFEPQAEPSARAGAENEAPYTAPYEAPYEAPYDAELYAEYKNFSKVFSIFAAISVGLFILSPIVFMVFEQINDLLAIVAFLIFVAIPTTIFVFFGMKEDYYKEELGIKGKQKRSKNDKSCGDDGIMIDGVLYVDDDDDPAVAAIYIIATIIFLLLGFLGGWWHPGWLVFLFATAIVVIRESRIKSARDAASKYKDL